MGTDKLASSIDYAQQLVDDRAAAAATAGAATYSTNATPVVGLNANFDASYVAYNASTVTQAGSSYTVNDGDSLASIALSVWGDASLWYVIADANGLEADANLVAGQSLILPDKVVNLHNTSQTFKPYNPNDALGDTTPTLPKEPQPPAPKKHGCGTLGTIIATIVSIVVTAIVTVATSGMNFILQGAIVAAAADASYQGTQMLVGNQSKFNWAELGASAVAGAIEGGLGLNTPAKNVLGAIGKAAARNIISQGANIAFGVQKKFDWTSLAVAGVVGYVGYEVGGWADKHKMGPIGKGILVGTASLLAGAATKSLITGQDFDKSLRETLPDAIGSTIGNLIAGQIVGRMEMEKVKKQAKKALADFKVVTASPNVSGQGRISPSSGACFLPGTLVHTEQGLKPIEQIVAGDMVASRDQHNADSSINWRRVSKTHQHTDRIVTHLIVRHPDGDEETISATSEHPFFVNGTTWRPACDLIPGDYFERLDGNQCQLISAIPSAGLHTVYNLTVDQDHTYFVGSVGIWVHNVTVGSGYSPPETSVTLSNGLTVTRKTNSKISVKLPNGNEWSLGFENYGIVFDEKGYYAAEPQTGEKLAWKEGQLFIFNENSEMTPIFTSWGKLLNRDKVFYANRSAQESLRASNFAIHKQKDIALTSMVGLSSNASLNEVTLNVPDISLAHPFGGAGLGMLLGSARPYPQAEFGRAFSNSYRKIFFANNPHLNPTDYVVHHAVEQQTLEKYPGIVTKSEINSLENLRGIPKHINSELHLGDIRREWNDFIDVHDLEGSVPTKQQLLEKATEIDAKYGAKFEPPVVANPHAPMGKGGHMIIANRIAFGGRALGIVGTAYGAYVDAQSLNNAFQSDISSKNGTYYNTMKEGARIGVAWALSAKFGTEGALIGAEIGAFGGPIGFAVGGIVGGVIGGGIGYYVGSKAVESVTTQANPIHTKPTRTLDPWASTLLVK